MTIAERLFPGEATKRAKAEEIEAMAIIMINFHDKSGSPGTMVLFDDSSGALMATKDEEAFVVLLKDIQLGASPDAVMRLYRGLEEDSDGVLGVGIGKEGGANSQSDGMGDAASRGTLN